VDSLATNQELVMLGLRLHLKDENYTYKILSVADPHHVDADPDPPCHFDADVNPDPTFHLEADPDPNPSFQIRLKTFK
jgi:hypothetical protein